MYINKSNRTDTKLKRIRLILVALIALGGIIVVLEKTGVTNFYTKPVDSSDNPYSDISDTKIEGDPEQTSEKTDQKNSHTSAFNNKKPEDFQTSSSGNISITQLEQKDGQVIAHASVSDFTPAQCVYLFTIQDGKPVVRETSGSCSKITVPQSEFDRIGTYTLTATAYSENAKITAKREINVQ